MAQITDAPAVSPKPSVPILIIDDNSSKREALKAILAPLGHSIVEADSGLAGLRCLMRQDFAVILLDVRMPVMDGFETATLIRQRRQSEMTPIIFITAHGSDEMQNIDVYAQGAVDFIFAPVKPEELRAKVSVFASLFSRAEELAARAQDLQKSTDQLRLLTDAAPIGIFQTDANNRYVYTNPGWTEITGIPAEKAAGREWDTIVPAGERSGLNAELAGGALDRAELSHRFEISPPGAVTGRIVIVTSKAIPDNDGGIAGWVGTLGDVTAEAGAEAAMADARDKATETSRLKSDFLANMSHEIRTPMNGVIGMTDLLLETELDDYQRDYAQTVRSSGQALLNIINDILDFSKVEAGKLTIEEIEFDVRSIVDDVVDLLVGPAHAKGLTLTPVIERSIPDVVRGDPGRVRQVLINLIGNAIKFTHTGEIVVRVTQDDSGGEDTVIRFQISDTGDGVAPDKLTTVFHPFVQGDSTTSRKYGGTGLGLSISSQLVALMGGDCGVSSRLGVGSDFWFTIAVNTGAGRATDAGIARVNALALEDPLEPAAGLDGPSANGHALTRSLSARQGPPGLLLLAEDNPVNQRVAKAMLEHLGFEVDVAEDGAEAVKAVTQTPYQAILMDCQMPILDGYQATREIRRVQGVSTRTPIIAVTASAMSSDQQRCLAAGMDDYLPKPLSLKALDAVLARWAPSGDSEIAADRSTSTSEIAPAPADGPALDAKVVDHMMRLGKAKGENLVEQLATLFLVNADARVVALREALAEGDAAAVLVAAHTLNGASSNMGATGLAGLCATLEADGATGNLDRGAAMLEAVEAELLRVRSALDATTLAV
ncbi:MAG: response regulator [Actinomycetota bacterium]|nr:response regulator [Actinomycetota bacterium]